MYRECFHNVASSVDELLVQISNQVGMIDYHLRYEGTCLQVTTWLEFENITFGRNDLVTVFDAS